MSESDWSAIRKVIIASIVVAVVLTLLGGCAAAQVKTPVIEFEAEEEVLPTYQQCVAVCEKSGRTPVGVYSGSCNCGLWDT